MEVLTKLREAMAREGVEAMLVTDYTNVGWLTGFTGTFGRVIVTPTDSLFITDSRYTIQAAEEVADIPVVTFASPVNGDDFTAKELHTLGVTRVGFEAATNTYSTWEDWTK